MSGFIYIVASGILLFFEIVIFAWVISTWLVQFSVINSRNPAVNQITRFLWLASRPLLRPVQRIIPPLGGVVDLSPLIVLLVLEGARGPLLNWVVVHLAAMGI